MIPLALWLTVCALHGPACHTVPLVPDSAVGLAAEPLQPPFSVLGCQTGGQALAAAWEATHPAWHVVSWRCGPEEMRT